MQNKRRTVANCVYNLDKEFLSCSVTQFTTNLIAFYLHQKYWAMFFKHNAHQTLTFPLTGNQN